MRVRPWTAFSLSLFSRGCRALAAALRCSKVNLFMFVPSQILYTRVWFGNYSRILYFFLLSTGRKIKAQNTIPLHTFVICFVSRHPSVFTSHFDSLSVGLFLCQLWCSLWYMHQFHWILFYSLLCIQLLAATASWLLVFEKRTHALGKQNNMQMLRLHAHTTVSHMHTLPALKFNAGRNYELLPQVSAKQLFGILYWVVACTWSSGLVSKRWRLSRVVVYDWARNKL